MGKTFLHVGCGQARKQNTTEVFKTDEWSENIFNEVILTRDVKTMIFDAGALHFMSETNLEINADMVLTPHPGEAAKLLGISNNEVQDDRINAAKSISNKFSAYVILKGKETIICSANDKEIFVCSEGGPELSLSLIHI